MLSHYFCNCNINFSMFQLIKRQSCQLIEISQLICRANQFTGFYMVLTLAFNELSNYNSPLFTFKVNFISQIYSFTDKQ